MHAQLLAVVCNEIGDPVALLMAVHLVPGLTGFGEKGAAIEVSLAMGTFGAASALGGTTDTAVNGPTKLSFLLGFFLGGLLGLHARRRLVALGVVLLEVAARGAEVDIEEDVDLVSTSTLGKVIAQVGLERDSNGLRTLDIDDVAAGQLDVFDKVREVAGVPGLLNVVPGGLVNSRGEDLAPPAHGE